ncbi:hypothetical protein M758_4G272900 [Ceratodon purpureus]|nr:hypothetical protein M758_4G272900 [Ceratodon purpureus]
MPCHAKPRMQWTSPPCYSIIYLPYCTALHCMALAMALQSSMAMASAWLHLRLRLPLGLPLLLLLLLLLNLLNLLFARLPFPFMACTPLDDYVLKPDANYRWHDTGGRLRGRFITGAWEGVVLNMTSQAWLSPTDVDRPIWTHNLVIVTPERIEYETAFILIGGGSNTGEPPTATDELLLLAAALAVKTRTLAAVLYQVPNQPLHFSGDKLRSSRSEDDIIAYTWAHFFEDTRRTEWPAHIPMTKATIRALDTVQSYASSQLKLQVQSFVVGGASKRGWTTWLTGAVDKRVVGIVPMVMDLLNSVKNLHHFYRSLGGWPVPFEPYYLLNITAKLDSTEFDKLMAIVDPYVYIHRLTMPKLIVTSSNDEFFLIDDSMFFWDELEGEKHHLILANSEHSLTSALPKLLEATEAFHLSIAKDIQSVEHAVADQCMNSRPQCSWTFDGITGSFVVSASEKPLKATLWYAYTIPRNGRRDFRWLTADLGNCSTFVVAGMCFQPILFRPHKLRTSAFIASGSGTYSYAATAALPKEGFGAYFVELKFRGPQITSPFIFTTEAAIAPDGYPFADCHGDHCYGTLL